MEKFYLTILYILLFGLNNCVIMSMAIKMLQPSTLREPKYWCMDIILVCVIILVFKQIKKIRNGFPKV